MDPMTIGAIAGLGKGLLFDAPQAKRDRQLAASTAALSPWTGLQPTMPKEANILGSSLQGAMAGGMFGQANPGMGGAEAVAGPLPGADASMAMNVTKPRTFMSVYDQMAVNPSLLG